MRIGNIAIISLSCALTALAQEKISVPLTNPSQPATIKANLVSGSIRVTGGTGREVVVTTSERSSRRGQRDGAPPGMKRIGGQPGVDIEESHNIVTISSGGMGDGGDFVIEVPVNTNL